MKYEGEANERLVQMAKVGDSGALAELERRGNRLLPDGRLSKIRYVEDLRDGGKKQLVEITVIDGKRIPELDREVSEVPNGQVVAVGRTDTTDGDGDDSSGSV